MKSIKKAKKWAKFKQGLIKGACFIFPYIPMVAVFIAIDILLTSVYSYIVVKVLAVLALLGIFHRMWKFTNSLCSKVDKWIKNRFCVEEDV